MSAMPLGGVARRIERSRWIAVKTRAGIATHLVDLLDEREWKRSSTPCGIRTSRAEPATSTVLLCKTCERAVERQRRWIL